jgi:sec-independent protein translocase protein TatC
MKENLKEMSFLEHLEQLRWHIIRSLSAVSILSIVAFLNKKIIFDYILFAPKNPDFISNRFLCFAGKKFNIDYLCINSSSLDLVNTKMSGQITTHITISLIAGLILASPYVFWELWRFVSPALYSRERKYTRGAVWVVTFLFITGILFGYYIIAPLTIYFLGSYSVSDQVKNLIEMSSYFSSVTSVILATGLVFELPVVIYFLSKIGFISSKFLKKYRKHAIIIILIIGAIITPPDVFSQVLVSIPLYLLFEVSILVASRVEKAKNKNA